MFELNHKFLQNEKTLTLVQDKILAELFKITLGSFRRKRSKETDIISGDVLTGLNELIEKVENCGMRNMLKKTWKMWKMLKLC